jgi:hypothetical protein
MVPWKVDAGIVVCSHEGGSAIVSTCPQVGCDCRSWTGVVYLVGATASVSTCPQLEAASVSTCPQLEAASVNTCPQVDAAIVEAVRLRMRPWKCECKYCSPEVRSRECKVKAMISLPLQPKG